MTLRPQHRRSCRLIAHLAAVAAAFECHLSPPSPARRPTYPERRHAAITAVFLLAACSPPRPAAREEFRWIPTTSEAGVQENLIARVCRPDAIPAPVVVINHGSPENMDSRGVMQPASCGSEPARWFLARGYVVVFPLRRGFGASTGALAEGSGPCDNPDYVRAGEESARDVAAAVDYATALPYAERKGAVVVGQSLGGWAVTAFAAEPHPEIAALISIGGGRGGHAFGDGPGNCRPDLLVAAAAAFGRRARKPMLWIYAVNDTFFPPDLVRAMFAAFTQAGGHAVLAQPGFPGAEGHALFYAPGGARVWGPIVAAYLAAPPPS
jgi:pimeloyl-ACP methyl ester carboxylesterase